MKVNFDALSRDAYKSQNAGMEEKNRLWKEVFLLEKWHFIARGQLPNIWPYVSQSFSAGVTQNMVMAFTDTEKLYQFAQEKKVCDEKGTIPVLSLPVKTIIPFLLSLTHKGVWGIHFNANQQSSDFFSPLQQLPVIFKFVTEI